MASALNLTLSVDPLENPDAEERDETAQLLLDEILGELNTLRAEPLTKEAEHGTKAPEVIVAGSLLITLLPKLLPSLLNLIKGFVDRGNSTIIIKKGDLELKFPAYVSPETLKQYLAALKED